MLVFLKNILCSDLNGITVQQGKVLKTKDVTENPLTPEQIKIKNTIVKTDVSQEEILKSILSNKRHYTFLVITFLICFIYSLVFTLLGVFAHWFFLIFVIVGVIASLLLLSSVLLHIQDKRALNKQVQRNNIIIVQRYVKQKLVEIKDNSENEYEENYIILDDDNKIECSKRYFDLLQKNELIYSVYTSDGSKLLKIYPAFAYNV